MKERPILFSGPMVRAIRAGTKVQTRRVVKQQPPSEADDVSTGMYHPTVIDKRGEEQPGNEIFGAWTFDGYWAARCPYGQPGDRLWVREAFGHFERNDTLKPGDTIYYRADGECLELQPWRPSIHMPRWASRITLEVTGVRVERLQDISEADAAAEGISEEQADGVLQMAEAMGHREPKPFSSAYQTLWESINGEGSWDANPFVWVVEFRKLG